jgi:hypothetical protein
MFQVNEAIHVCVCARRLHEARLDGKPARALIRRRPEVAALLLSGSTVGDVTTFVGLERFVRYRQRDEIVESRPGASALDGEVSDLDVSSAASTAEMPHRTPRKWTRSAAPASRACRPSCRRRSPSPARSKWAFLDRKR